MSIDLRSGLVLEVEQPVPPIVNVTQPGPADAVVVPVAGPRGEQGPTGPDGPMGPSGGAYRHTQSSPVLLVQVVHNLTFDPGGVVCVETDGTVIEYAGITHPLPGVTEITFGVLHGHHLLELRTR